MKTLLTHYKPFIDAKLDELTILTKDHPLPWAADAAKRLGETSKRGKSVRGCLFLAAVDTWTGTILPEDISLGTVLEYIHTALLIHDDLLDHDDLRRGLPSIHKQFEQESENMKIKHSSEYGKAMALCLGDIAIFGGFSLFASIQYEPTIKDTLQKILAEEFLLVGFGEMQDIYLTYKTENVDIADVLNMYTYKTARYTFSLPLKLAAVRSGMSHTDIKKIEMLGELLGLLFQLTDDQLTLTGDQEIVGKTIGNDITENKKTIYNILLRQRANTFDTKILNDLFGKKNISQKDITMIKTLIHTYEIDTYMHNQITELTEKIEHQLQKLTIDTTFLQQILTYLLTRTN